MLNRHIPAFCRPQRHRTPLPQQYPASHDIPASASLETDLSQLVSVWRNADTSENDRNIDGRNTSCGPAPRRGPTENGAPSTKRMPTPFRFGYVENSSADLRGNKQQCVRPQAIGILKFLHVEFAPVVHCAEVFDSGWNSWKTRTSVQGGTSGGRAVRS